MKRILIGAFALLALAGGAQAQNIERVLQSIAANNPELKACRQRAVALQTEVKTTANLPDPTLSYDSLWGAGGAKITELTVAQSFDFPTNYVAIHRLNKLKTDVVARQTDEYVNRVLRQARELCLDIILLRRKGKLLDERQRDAEQLVDLYAEKLKHGECSVIETRKTTLEQLNVRTEARLNATELAAKLRELTALNGNIPLDFDDADYPPMPLPEDYNAVREAALATDYTLLALTKESEAATREIGVNRLQWLPKLEIGYRRNTEIGAAFNGLTVGFSFPLFANRHKVKQAKALSLDARYRTESARLSLETELAQAWEEAQALKNSMDEYEKIFGSQPLLPVLKEALAGGELSLIDYFTEITSVYQSRINYCELENRYRKAMGKLYRRQLVQ
jgi:outer membrane protein TolC